MKKIKKEDTARDEFIRKSGSEEYEPSWDEKGINFKKKTEVKKGRKSRAAGSRFELKVRRDLEDKGRIVDKWTNNVDLVEGKLVIAKRKYNPFSKVMVIGTGFPDFISIKQIYEGSYSVIGVEVKMNGVLSKIEKEKCAFYLQKGIFSAIWIAKKGAPKGVPSSTKKKNLSEEGKKRGGIEYEDFLEKYGTKYNKT